MLVGVSFVLIPRNKQSQTELPVAGHCEQLQLQLSCFVEDNGEDVVLRSRSLNGHISICEYARTSYQP